MTSLLKTLRSISKVGANSAKFDVNYALLSREMESIVNKLFEAAEHGSVGVTYTTRLLTPAQGALLVRVLRASGNDLYVTATREFDGSNGEYTTVLKIGWEAANER